MSDERQGVEAPAGTPERKTRRSRLSASNDDFHIPDEWKKPGMSYQWEVIRVLKETIDDSEFVRIADGGWEPVTPKEMPGAVPNNYKGTTIDRKGQRLYKRPQYLTDEAIAEDLYIARQQKQAKIDQVYDSPKGEAKRTVQTMQVKAGSDS